ncbi:MAG: hypothetical protein PF482_04840 [Desulfobacteraceae bacterium]|nr:hypothetical protein [Desulfobacteraceae bacterium]
MKKFAIVIPAFVILLFCTNVSMADDFSFRLSANQNALDSEFIGLFDVADSQLMGSIAGFYDTDDYKMISLNALIVDEVFCDGFTGGLGFRGAGGEAEKINNDGDILNLGFVCYANYDLSKSTINQYPITFSSSFCFAPEPLSFVDTKYFMEVLAECSWKVLDQAALVANYRYIKIKFKNHTNWKKSDNAGYIGLRFLF